MAIEFNAKLEGVHFSERWASVSLSCDKKPVSYQKELEQLSKYTGNKIKIIVLED